MRWLALAAETTSNETVSPSARLVLGTILLVLAVTFVAHLLWKHR